MNYKKNQKRFIKVFLSILLILLLLRGDLYIANIIFKQQCEKDDVGLTVFEKVELGDEYFLKLPPVDTRAYRELEKGYIYDDQLYIDKGLLDVNFDTYVIEKKIVSRFGPVTQANFNMVRRKDKKVLSTYKRYRKSRGWLGSLRYGPLTIWSTKVDSCPKRSISEALNSKSQVIQTFIKKS